MAAASVDKLQRFDSEMSNAAQDTAEAMQVERAADEDADEDLYTRLKTLQRQLEFFEIQVNLLTSRCAPTLCGLDAHALLRLMGLQEEYIKEEQHNLKRELLRAQEEVKRIQAVPLVIGQFLEMVDQVRLSSCSLRRVLGTASAGHMPCCLAICDGK